jgi:hypothetical protein
MRRVIHILLGVCLCACGAWAQASANKGEIAITVFDQNQAVIPNAALKATNTGTGVTREAKTDEQGRYRFVLLDAGQYDVSVEMAGFAPAALRGVVVNVGSTVDLPVTLQVGGTSQTIEVGETLLSVDLPAPQTHVNSLAIRNLPINGRRFQDFALLTPAVQVDSERQQLSFVGQRGINSNVMVDGADYNNPFFGGIRGGERSNFVFTVPQSSIQEFQVVTTGYTAEYGRSTGGILNAITKSGSNELHGDAFYQLRHKELGLQTPFKRQILETQHQYGGSAGGALKKDKLFWFAAYEQQQANTPRQIVFGSLANVAPNGNTSEAFNYYKSLEGPFASTNDALATTARADWQLGASRLTLRYNFSDASAENAATVGGAAETLTNNALSNNGTEKDRTHSGVMQLTSILGPSVANDLRFSTTYELRPRTANELLPTVSNAIGQFGSRNFLPTTQDDTRVQINDGISISRGRHLLKFGGDYNYLTTFQLFGFNQFGFFGFNTSNVSDILEILSVGGPTANRFDSPLVTYQRQIGNLEAGLNIHQIALYGQDSWRVHPKLTLELGLRWEAQLNPSVTANNTQIVDAIKGVRLPIGISLDPTTIPDAMKQIMPRFGFSYRPFQERTVIRGHAGIFYAATPMLLFADQTNNFRLPPGNVSISLPTAGSTVYRDLLSAGVDLNRTPLGQLPIIDIATVNRAATGAGAAPDPFRNARVTLMASDFENPRAFQAGLGVDHEVAHNLVAGVQFHYVNTVHLQRNRDVNLPAPFVRVDDRSQRPIFGVTAAGAARVLRPISTLDRITLRESSARSMYRGVSFSTRYRAGRLQFGAFYTLSEAFSDDDAERSATTLYYENAFNLRNEYGYSRLDARHQFTGNALVTLPWGMELSGIYRMRSGFPVDPLAGSDLNQDGNNQERPFSAPGVPFARNSFRNYAYQNFDLRFLKNFALGERARLQFSTEMFNLFDADNIAVIAASTNTIYGPGIDPASGAEVPARATFLRKRLPDGSYDPVNTQQGTPFQAQFGLRLIF